MRREIRLTRLPGSPVQALDSIRPPGKRSPRTTLLLLYIVDSFLRGTWACTEHPVRHNLGCLFFYLFCEGLIVCRAHRTLLTCTVSACLLNHYPGLSRARYLSADPVWTVPLVSPLRQLFFVQRTENVFPSNSCPCSFFMRAIPAAVSGTCSTYCL